MTFNVDLDYGSLPDGSRMKWDNTAQRDLPIMQVSWAIPTLEPPTSGNEPQESALESQVKKLSGTLWTVTTQLSILIAVVVLGVIVMWSRH
jgi:hypothetical protein